MTLSSTLSSPPRTIDTRPYPVEPRQQNGARPIFRSFPPSASQNRLFPRYLDIVTGQETIAPTPTPTPTAEPSATPITSPTAGPSPTPTIGPITSQRVYLPLVRR
ncbi:MAG: hypothetical protein EOM24_32105 [Chloroflexia bacterium]|nr:hypothetical protein [Chloroflexia bacterium]